MANIHIGDKLKTLRETHQLSVSELSERSGVNAEVIESIELEGSVSSLAPLTKLCRSLGVRLGTLLDDDTKIGPAVTRAGEAETIRRESQLETGTSESPLNFFSLAPGRLSRHMDPFMIDVAPAQERSLSQHEGEEFIYVMSGEIEIEYGKETYTLAEGDSIYYDSIVPHQVRGGKDGARILAVVYAPA